MQTWPQIHTDEHGSEAVQILISVIRVHPWQFPAEVIDKLKACRTIEVLSYEIR